MTKFKMPFNTVVNNLKKRLPSSSMAIYFIVYGSSVLVALIKTLNIAAVLAPEQMGVFVSLSLVSALMIYSSNLGVMDAYLSRTRSIQRREASAALLRGQLYIVVTIMSATITALILACAYIYQPLQGQALYLPLAAAYIFLQPLQAATLIDLQADRQLIKYASYTLIKSAIPLILIAAAILLNFSYIDINFVLACDVITTGALVGLTVGSYKDQLLFQIRPSLVFRLIKQGIYFTGQGLLNNITSNLDKWFVVTTYGLASAGAYSISNQMILVGTAIGGMITTYMIPNINISNSNRREVINLMAKWSAGLAILGSLAAIIFLHMFWSLINEYYSRYTIKFEIFACTAVTMALIGSNYYEVYFRAVKMGVQYLYIQVVSNLLLVFLLLAVYFFSLNILWVAVSVMLAKLYAWIGFFWLAKQRSILI